MCNLFVNPVRIRYGILSKLALALFFNFSNAYCQDNKTEPDALYPDASHADPITIVITGSNIPVYRENLPLNISTIGRDEIDKINPQSLPQLLNEMSGVYVENSQSRAGVSNVYMRGADPNFTLIMINGMKVNDPSNNRGGGFDLSLIDVNSIERIEVYKGPGSFIYGSTPLSGVINIITGGVSTDAKRVPGSATTVTMESGSRGFANSTATVNSLNADRQLFVSANYLDEGEQLEDNRFISRAVTAGSVWQLSAGQSMKTDLFYDRR